VGERRCRFHKSERARKIAIGLPMTEPSSTQDTADSSVHSSKVNLLWRKLPYVVVLLLAILGVAYANISRQPLTGYWEFLALTIGVVCIVTNWPQTDDRQARVRLIWTQALHWATFLVMMNIMLLPGVQTLLPAPANSLVLLMLLALGTFLAGINLLSLEICFLGIAMALSVPAIAWLKQSALLLTLAAVLLIGLGIAFWPRQGKKHALQTHQSGPDPRSHPTQHK
jgi:hypothetical protein